MVTHSPIAVSKPKNRDRIYKYGSLVALAIQGAITALSMRYSRIRVNNENIFLSSTAVILTELTKLFVCLAIVFFCEAKRSPKQFFNTIWKTISNNKIDTLKIGLPSLLYVIQNNLLFVVASNLDAASYQVSAQFTLITTAIFAVIILHKKLLITQWTALYFLIAGITLIQMTDQKKPTVINPIKQNRLLGMVAAICASTLSGLAGVYLEKSLKRIDISLWMRNVQMGLFSVPLAIVTCLASDFNNIQSKGFFHGYDWFVVYLVLLNASCGLLVGLVFKYADNILKGFATSCSIIILCIASVYLFEFNLTIQFGIGVLVVIGSIFLYGHVPKPRQNEMFNKYLKQKDIEIQSEQTGIEINEENGVYIVRM